MKTQTTKFLKCICLTSMTIVFFFSLLVHEGRIITEKIGV